MNRLFLLSAITAFLFVSCTPSQDRQAKDTADSLQEEMEKEMDTAKQKLDSLGNRLNEATNEFMDETEKTLDKAGESLKDTGK